MYRVLQKVSDNGMEPTYKFVTKVDNKKVIYYEFNSKQEVDEYVEFQLNCGIPKTSLEVVEYVPYKVTADLLENNLYQPAPQTAYTMLTVPTSGAIGQPIAFQIDCELSKFLGVKVNGVPIHNSMYTLSSGSTIVEFRPEYTAQLNEGEYKFTFLFEDGIAETSLRIEIPREEEEEPDFPPEGEDTPTAPITPPEDEDEEEEVPSDPSEPSEEEDTETI